MRLVVLARSGDGLVDDIEDMEAAVAGLVECLGENLIAEAVALDIHLGGGDTLGGTGHLEVHVAEMVLVAEDVGEDGIFYIVGVGDQTHSHTGHRTLHLHAGVEQREGSAADSGHRRGTVALEDIGNDTAGVGEIIGEHALEGAVSEVSVTDLAASHATLWLGLAGGEGGEVVVKQEALLALIEHVVDDFLIEGGSEGGGDESLGLASGEYRGSVGTGEIIHLAPDGADLGGLAAVEADTLVEHAAAHGLLLHIVIVAFHHGYALVLAVLLKLLLGHLGEGGDIFLADGVELLVAPMLVGSSCARYGVGLVIAFGPDIGSELVVVDLVAVLALGFLAGLFHQLELRGTVFLDFFVSDLEGLEKLSFRNFVHLTLDHHDVVIGGADHKLDVGFLDLLECGVDDPFAVDACHADLGDRAVEGHVAAHQGSGGCDSGERVGRVVLISRI